MPHRPVSLRAPKGSVAASEIAAAIDGLLAEAAADGAPSVEFPAEVLAAAEAAASAAEVLAAAEAAAGAWREGADAHEDATDVPFVTLDPASSTDLDQAMHLERTEDGYRVRYAIADVPLFVALDSVLDAEARRRGETVYLPDRRIPLHPTTISEGAASLLPDQAAPAFVWDLRLDGSGTVTGTSLGRAVVRSREKLAYEAVQDGIDAGDGHPMMLLLQEIGALRTRKEAERGGASLNIPEQDVEADGDRVHLAWRSILPIEDANAQISLMTGMAAADLMIRGGAGILRTMPPAPEENVGRFRRQAAALGVPWSEALDYGAFLRTLDWHDPRHLALLNQAASLFRGAAYAAFTHAGELPEDTEQAALGAPYAHSTAPLRRLVDRFVLLTCLHHARGEEVPPALAAALPQLPEIMQTTGSVAGSLERRALDLVERTALAGLVGETFEGTIIDRRGGEKTDDEKTDDAKKDDEKKGGGTSPVRVEVQLLDPPVTAWVEADGELGGSLRVRLESVDVAGAGARFVPVEESAS
ncbi:RNB domain-containing ribonuclease [Brachybacterium halotolerans subsp. kimchii]|uniref:RNB domain-containing ribonuclease n=1 Tax=Brachybacterium halotolerans TaxID=2795215 RepID=UPI001E35521B|nr:RNB domain-containing ribonuclease [Brachybacterium halotolerans]UEJ83195.1 RNB domain-containing ribonuclease [Brachybacterium halotolerans subsp. kimchii]